jgi:hypothetical protein
MSEPTQQAAKVGDDCERITEPLYQEYWARHRAGGITRAVEWVTNLRPEVRNLFAAHACWIDAGCGGFGVFYTTSFGALAAEAVEGLRALGLPRCASVVAEANRFFGVSVPRDHQARRNLVESAEWDFSELDHRFWTAIQEEAPDKFLAVADAYAQSFKTEQDAATEGDCDPSTS